VVVVVGGLGSIPGAFVAALLIGVIKAFCIGLGYSKATLVVEFVVMAGAGDAAVGPARPAHRAKLRTWTEVPLGRHLEAWRRSSRALALLLVALPALGDQYALILATDMLVFAVFARACTS